MGRRDVRNNPVMFKAKEDGVRVKVKVKVKVGYYFRVVFM
jgi:hypothetical protein